MKIAKKNKLKIIGHFIVGLPGSSKKTENDTIKFSKKLKINFAQFYIATPFPGSEFYKEAKKNKWFKNDEWSKVEQGTATVSYPNFSAEQIQVLKRRAYKEFYLRPFAFYSLFTSISFKTILKLPSYFFKFTSWMKK